MKKIYLGNIILSLSFLITTLNLYGQVQEIKKQYHFENYRITHSGDYQFIEIEGATQSGKPGDPVLPYFDMMQVLPAGYQAGQISVLLDEPFEMEGTYKIYPQQYSRPLSSVNAPEFIINENVYRTNSMYPAESYTPVKTGYLNGYAMAMSVFTPVKYNPVSGKVFLYKKVVVTIKAEKSQKSIDALRMVRNSPAMIQRITSISGKSDVLKSYTSAPQSSDPYQILIITNEDIATSLTPLTSDYLHRGYQPRMITVNQIIQSTDGIDIQEKIRNYIIQQYLNNAIEFVLLAGDHEVVPARGFYCHVQSSSVVEDDFIPADVYYSALDGTWNDDNDNHWGEPDEDDLLPDIPVGRLPASNAAEMQVMVFKILSYLNRPIENELNRPFLVGEKLWDNPLTYGGNYLDLLIGEHNDNGYTTTGIPATANNIEKLYDRDLTQEWTATTLISKINTGKSFIHHVGHSNTDFVMRLYSSDITTNNFNNVNGVTHNFTLIYTHGCICGAFDSNDCIAEEMLKINRLAAAFVGNSRYGWFNEGQTEGPSQHLHREFVHALYTLKENHIGATHMISKIRSAPWVEAANQWEPGALRWVFYDCNVLGDPFMPVWIGTPGRFNIVAPSEITMGQQAFSGSLTGTGQYGGFRVSLIQNEQIMGSAMTDSSGNFTIFLDKNIISFDTVKLSAVGYNTYCQSVVVAVARPAGPFILTAGFAISDSNNNLADCNEEIVLKPYFINHGNGAGHNCIMRIVEAGPPLKVIDSVASVPLVAPPDPVLASDGFVLKIKMPKYDQQQVKLNVIITSDDTLSWPAQLTMTINRPKFEFGNVFINDIQGNNNQIINPGEPFSLIVPLKNKGHAGFGASSLTISSNGNVEISNPVFNMDTIMPGQTIFAAYEMISGAGLQPGNIIHFLVNAHSDCDTISITLDKMVTLVMENFESGNFNMFPYTMDGTKPWITDTQSPYQGSFCAVSGDINDNENSIIKLTINVLQDGQISFAKKVSSESSYDKLKFYIDDVEKADWSGQIDWATHNYPISHGLHTVKWEYMKDYSVSTGQDCAWIDNILFPQLNFTDNGQVMLSQQFINHYLAAGQTDTLRLIVYNLSPQVQNFTLLTPGQFTWMHCSGNSGTLQPFSSQMIDLIFNASDMPEGYYSGNLIFQAGDEITVPVQLSVTSPATGMAEIGKFSFRAYPNPFNNEIYLSFRDNHSKNLKIKLVSLANGNVMYYHEVKPDASYVIPAGELKLFPGIYLLQITDGKNITTLKMIKMP